MSDSRYPAALLAAVLAVLVWSGIAPYDRFTWLLEVAPTIAGLAILIPTRHRFPFTPLVYTLIAIHMSILCVGGKYTYALVPAGNWLRDAWHLSRNHYDRLGHVAQGFVPAMIARELFIRLNVVRTVPWRTFIIVFVCLGISASYELVEWIVALVSGEASDSFLGTQGDPWDTQTDMALAFAGAMFALATLHWWHDRQLERFQRAESAR
jgi:putative membrane protein